MSLPNRTTIFPCQMDDGPYMTLLSHLDPDDLGNFSLVCKETDRKVRAFTTILKRIHAFNDEVVIKPWNTYRVEQLDLFKKIKETRVLTEEEHSQAKALQPDFDHRISNAKSTPLIASPSLMELVKISPDFIHLFLKKDFDLKKVTTCYAKLSELVFKLLKETGPRENEEYQKPDERIKELATKLKQSDLTSYPTIEDAIWKVIENIEGNRLESSSSDCKKFLQSELKKIETCNLLKILDTLESTFADVEKFYKTGKKLEVIQHQPVREKILSYDATIADNLRIDSLLNWGAFALGSLVNPYFQFYISEILPDNYYIRQSIYTVIIVPALRLACGQLIVQPLHFTPRIATIAQDEQGEEVVNYHDHPLRPAAKLWAYSVSVASITYVTYLVASRLIPYGLSFFY